jgi:hypothetical protein
MTEDKEPPAEESPLKSEVTIEYLVESVETHVISITPPAFKVKPPAGDVPPQPRAGLRLGLHLTRPRETLHFRDDTL